MHSQDPLRNHLQLRWNVLCHCDHCFDSSRNQLSPIEVMFESALFFHRYDDQDWEYHIQWPVLTYIADFVIITPRSRVVIECDGHDYHERTKQQAARDRSRDRAMTEVGWRVMRFTGSEIWANPFACAKQAIDLALREQVDADEIDRGRGGR